jgi:hypothetical protein
MPGPGQGPTPTYQPDCRVTAHNYLEQDWSVPPGSALRDLRVPVFQRVYVTNPMMAPTTQPPTKLDAPLTVELSSAAGSVTRTLPPESVSWAPDGVTLHLPTPIPGGTSVRLRLETRATDGCYGVLVDAKSDATAGFLRDAGYRAVEDGRVKPAPDARMFAIPAKV